MATETATAAGAAKKAKRDKIAKKVFVAADGSESAHASPEAVALEFRFANGPVRRYELSQFPQNIRDCFAWNGFSQKGGDAYAGEKGQDAVDKHDAVVETLMGGDWVKRGERVAGVPSTMLFEAYCDYLRGMGKKSPDTDEGKVKIGAYIKGLSKEEKKGLEADPQIAAILAQIKAKRAAEAAKAAKAAAREAEVAVAAGTEQFE